MTCGTMSVTWHVWRSAPKCQLKKIGLQYILFSKRVRLTSLPFLAGWGEQTFFKGGQQSRCRSCSGCHRPPRELFIRGLRTRGLTAPPRGRRLRHWHRRRGSGAPSVCSGAENGAGAPQAADGRGAVRWLRKRAQQTDVRVSVGGEGGWGDIF